MRAVEAQQPRRDLRLARGRTGRLVLVTFATALALAAVGSSAPAAGSAVGACGTRTRPPAVFRHVIWIWMENRSYDEIVGSPSAPFLNALAGSCGLATNYSAVSHPSLPNYIAATSGGTWGISDDNNPSAHPLAATSIFGQARSAVSYEESMPANCALTSSGSYAVKHNPEAYYTPVRSACRDDNVPLGTSSRGPFLSALRTNRLPAFSFVTPNICNDGHNCATATGDAWLKDLVSKITTSPTFRAENTVLFVTWDESDHSGENRVPTIVVSPFTRRGTRSGIVFTHYSLLRTTEELLGIRAHLGHAADAASMRAAFGL